MSANGAYIATVNGKIIGLAADFLSLTDTPAAYAGHALEAARVNAGVTALEFSLMMQGYSWATLFDGDVDTPGTVNWVTMASMTQKKGMFAGGVLNDIIYYSHGYQPSVASKDCWAYDPSTNTHSARADSPDPTRRMCDGRGLLGLYYVAYGEEPAWPKINDCDAYDPDTNSWASKTDAPLPKRNMLACATAGGLLYAIGGDGGITDHDAFDPDTGSWTSKLDMPRDRHAHTACTIAEIIYAYAGMSGVYLKSMDAYEPVSNTWTAKPDSPNPTRYAPRADSLGGILYASGGKNGAAPMADCDAYDPATNGWTGKANSTYARQLHQFRTVGSRIYKLGGQTNGDAASTWPEVEAFDPSTPYELWTGSLLRGDIIIIDTTAEVTIHCFGKAFVGASIFFVPANMSGNITIPSTYSYRGIRIIRGYIA